MVRLEPVFGFPRFSYLHSPIRHSHLLLLVLFWARRNHSKKSTVPLVLHIAGNFAAIVIWALSTMVGDIYWRYGMWFSSIVLEIVVLVVFSRRSSVTFAGSHLPERFALFTIIVLGEVTKTTLRYFGNECCYGRHLGVDFAFVLSFLRNRMSLGSSD